MTNALVGTLSDFLLARIAADEAVARYSQQQQQDRTRWSTPWDTFNPARVLAECGAKRAIVETRQLVDAHVRQVALTNPDEARDGRNTRAGLDVAIAALALPYADHPDYREEWKP